MLNRADAQYERQAETKVPQDMGAAREMTVGELIDRRIHKTESELKSLHVLKGALSQDFLNGSASRLGALLER